LIAFPNYEDMGRKYRLAKSLSFMNLYDELEPFREFLTDEITRLDTENRFEVSQEIMRQRQGACQTLSNLLKLMKGSDKLMAELRDSTG
jgi:hypothetical protein